ncbi:major facilitator superfamily domain-containing protein [Hygrophoropsis aurantiaca]|uniref:Major facilitator superfamily domain-containing protein n=1 Tax=Hygrophoropsis aurantiaca TaxID=72124 RepID=A0ACB8ALE8_9AGAM|nr:major facilitator superfamily domain-containing protein [Hygrophoropsis aurantiaca]
MATSSSGTIVQTPIPSDADHHEDIPAHSLRSKDFGFIIIPKRLRHDPEKPFHFGMLLNVSFGIGSTLVVANLYYCQPLLIQLSHSFGVTYDEVSRIPTLVQAGYGIGLLLISPLGDILRRRQLIMLLVLLSTTLTVPLAITNSLEVFEVISFFVGMTSVAPQLLMPLAADLAPPERRASAISVVLSGFLLGILIARVLAGVVANFTSWRIVYFMSIGVQGLVLIGAYLILPDYPSRNGQLSYFSLFRSMFKFIVTEPLVVQIILINIAASACYTNFWVTLTFLLGGAPYYYSTVIIGLMGLVGMMGVLVVPFMGRLIDSLVPWYATLITTILLLVFQAVQTIGGGVNIAAVVIACFGLDVFRQTQQISLSTRMFSISETARSRLNALLVMSVFLGQVTGTSVGTKVFVEHGWRADSILAMAWYVWQLAILLLRGPHCPRDRWFGYEGGLRFRKKATIKSAEDSGADSELEKGTETTTSAKTSGPLLDEGKKREPTIDRETEKL